MFASRLHLNARRAGALTGLIACACAGTAALSTSATAGTTHAYLKLLQRNPVKVAGHDFRARRLVTVTVTADGRQTRTVRTNRYGNFTLTFTRNISACTAWMISAQQARTQGALLRGPRPDCAPMTTN